MLNVNKEQWVEDYLRGYLDGKKEELELLNAEEMHDKINEITGYAKSVYDQFRMFQELCRVENNQNGMEAK